MSTLRPSLSVSILLTCVACSSTSARRDPTGEPFPDVRGETLEGSELTLPADLAGAPAILLLGYDMDAQFDIDRWILGLLQAQTPARLLELPTIPGMLPGLFAGSIDDGMRGGIPSEDWGSVVTLYGDDARAVEELTGSEQGRNARVILLDATGNIVWFADRGYSAAQVTELDRELRDLLPSPSTAPATASASMQQDIRKIFDFARPSAVEAWRSVDDRVMGGVSRSELRNGEGHAVFAGDLSTDQGGGFASVRSEAASHDLTGASGIAVFLRGDGRTYDLGLRTDDAFDGVTYRASLATTRGVWGSAHVPFELFQPVFRGRVVPDAPALDPARIRSFGFLVAGDRVGSFELEIAWLGTYHQP